MKLILFIFYLATIIGTPLIAIATDSLTVNAVRSSKWILRDDTVKSNKIITIQSFKNGHDSFQLAVSANGTSIKNVNAYLKSDLKNQQDGSILKENLKLYRELYLHITTPTGMHPELYPEGEFPDPLLPFYDPYSTQTREVGAPFDVSRIGSIGKSYLAIGDGGCFSDGFYTGTQNRNYVIEIEKEGELGEATFKWSDNWNGKLGNAPYQYYNKETKITSWNEVGRTTSDQTILLNHGVSVRFTGGKQKFGKTRINYKNETKYNFHTGDRYYLKVYNKSNEVIFGDLYIPPSTAPGDYQGTIIVTADDHTPVELPIFLTVYNITLPKSKSMDSSFGRSIDPRVYHRGSNDKLSTILKNYEELLHEHRIDHGVLNTAPRFTFNDQDEITSTDWTAFDAYAEPRLNGDYWNDGEGMRRFTFDFNWIYPGTSRKSDTKIKSIAQETARHLKEKGWFEKAYVYCLDEAGPRFFPRILDHIKIMKEADPDWEGKFMITSTPTRDNILLDHINIWCPTTFNFSNWSDYGKRSGKHLTRKEYKKIIIDKGNSFWLYVANYPTSGAYMSYQLDRLSCHEPRLLKWASWYEGASGFLFWSTIGSHAAVPNPYLNPWYTERYSRDGKANGINGDSFIIYPGDRDGSLGWKKATGHAVPFEPLDGPLPSIRLKQIRDGFEDWEMFLLAEKAGIKKNVRNKMKRVYKRLGSTNAEYAKGNSYWSRDDQLMWQVRNEIARLLEKKNDNI